MYDELGPLSKDEIKVSALFFLAIVFWISSKFIRDNLGIELQDAGVAIIAAILLFMIPSSEKNKVYCSGKQHQNYHGVYYYCLVEVYPLVLKYPKQV